jgi:hypothetical protein
MHGMSSNTGFGAFREEGRKNKPNDHQIGQLYGAPATGATTELIALAHDLYMLQKVDRLPEKLIERLRNYDEFQGARYEVAIAAAFVKCAFDITWINHRRGPHPEFLAINSRTGEEVYVETKSRRRRGVLHHPGTLPPIEQLRVDVRGLYKEALHQDPGDRPFAIFLDMNLPGNSNVGEMTKWQREVVDGWQNSDQQIGLLGFTNFAWHYHGNKPTDATGPGVSARRAYHVNTPVAKHRNSVRSSGGIQYLRRYPQRILIDSSTVIRCGSAGIYPSCVTLRACHFACTSRPCREETYEITALSRSRATKPDARMELYARILSSRKGGAEVPQ